MIGILITSEGVCPLSLHSSIEWVSIWIGCLLWSLVHILHDLVQTAQHVVRVDRLLLRLLLLLLLLLLILLLHLHLLLLVHHHLLLDALLHGNLHLVGHHVGSLAHEHVHHGVNRSRLPHHCWHLLLRG